MATLRLQASDGKALLIVGTNYHDKTSYHDGWWYCNVFLEKENDTIKMGEEGFEHIRSQMLSSLRPPYETKEGVLCGKEVNAFGVLSLMGPLAAIYGVPIEEHTEENASDARQGVDLYWQTVNMVDYLIMRLSEKDIRSWLTTLENTEQLPEKEYA